MSVTTTAEPATPLVAQAPEDTPDTGAPVAVAEKTRHDIFKYAAYVHVGEGAAECEHGEDGQCRDSTHFHAWVRLPNPFQIQDVTEKAKAAQARRQRMLRDTDSDAYAILEGELDALRDESLRDIIVGEILDEEYAVDHQEATRRVLDVEVPDFVPEDDEEVPKLYAHIAQDMEEFERQEALPEDQRGDDFEELTNTVQRYNEAVNAEVEEIQRPRREALKDRDLDELIDIVRRDRIRQSGTQAFLRTFNTWQWFVCTYKPRPQEKGTPNVLVWNDINQFKYEAPGEVIAALNSTFRDLEQRLTEDRAKNS